MLLRITLLSCAIFTSAFSAARELILDARNFGAKCDGTTDDAAAIQAAIDSLPDDGLLLISGRAAIGSAGLIVRKKAHITIKGATGESGFVATAATKTPAQGFGPVMILFQECQESTIKDLDIEMNNVGECAVALDRCNKCTAQHLTIRNTGYPGNGAIVGTGNHDCRYLGNTILKTGKGVFEKDGKRINDGTRGMWIGNVAENEREYHPLIEGNVVKNAAATGIATVAVGAVIRNNFVEDCNGAGVKIMPGDSKDETVIANNTLRKNLFHAIQSEGAANNVTIQSNTLEENAMCGIYVYGGFAGCRINDNTVSNNHRGGEGGWMAAIYLHHADDVIITGNHVYDSGGNDARRQDIGLVLNAVSGTTLKNVRIRNNSIANNSMFGMALFSTGGVLDDIEIDGNTVTRNSRVGIYIHDSGQGTLKKIVLNANDTSLNGEAVKDERKKN